MKRHETARKIAKDSPLFGGVVVGWKVFWVDLLQFFFASNLLTVRKADQCKGYRSFERPKKRGGDLELLVTHRRADAKTPTTANLYNFGPGNLSYEVVVEA